LTLGACSSRPALRKMLLRQASYDVCGAAAIIKTYRTWRRGFELPPSRRIPDRERRWTLVRVVFYNGIIRARSNSTPARPYMARLRVFSLLICPSVCPLLQGSDAALRTASMSWRMVLAKRCIA
jgi:hypothetical protein